MRPFGLALGRGLSHVLRTSGLPTFGGVKPATPTEANLSPIKSEFIDEPEQENESAQKNSVDGKSCCEIKESSHSACFGSNTSGPSLRQTTDVESSGPDLARMHAVRGKRDKQNEGIPAALEWLAIARILDRFFLIFFFVGSLGLAGALLGYGMHRIYSSENTITD